jgi:hypothetical protein
MRFTEPWYLLLLPVAWGWVWWTGRRLLGVSRARRRVILALRFALVLLIVLALAGWHGVGSLRSVCTVFVLDRSASVSDGGAPPHSSTCSKPSAKRPTTRGRAWRSRLMNRYALAVSLGNRICSWMSWLPSMRSCWRGFWRTRATTTCAR